MSKCRICECTDADGCAAEYGCTWHQPDLCSTCAEMLEYMTAYMIVVGPHDRHTVPLAALAVERCLQEILREAEAEAEQEPEPLIVLAKP